MQAVLLIVSSLLAAVVLNKASQFCIHLYTWYKSPLRSLPGPTSTSIMRGNLVELSKGADGTVVLEKWAAQYGHTFSYAGVSNSHRLFTMDLKAITHILNHPEDFPRALMSDNTFKRLAGEGLFAVHGEQHKRQRKIINPAFSPKNIRLLTGIFNEKAQQLCDALSTTIAADQGTENAAFRTDLLGWMTRATLDIIGLAGFNYDFKALDPTAGLSEFSTALDKFTKVAHSKDAGLFTVARLYLPFLRYIPNANNKAARDVLAATSRITLRLVADAKADAERHADAKNRDILSLLIRANMVRDVPPEQRLTESEVLGQVGTFLGAGHETTSVGTTWTLYALCTHPDVQSALREELKGVPINSPSMEELDALPLLDAVVHESLRLYPPVPSLQRRAVRDVVIPLDTPFTDKHGVIRNTVAMQRGDEVTVPFLAIQRSNAIWGEDAHEFNPYRFIGNADSAQHIPGIWGNLLSFSAGPRHCVGYRFSLVETKSLLFALLRAFEFELAVPASAICTHQGPVIHGPMVVGDEATGAQLPIIIRLAEDV